MTKAEFSGATLAILCGGASKRLGTDKGLYRPLGDEALVERAIRLLGEGFGDILVICRDEAQAQLYRGTLQGRPVRVLPDVNFADCATPRAAISGLYTALVEAKHDRLFVLPVDQVGVRASFLGQLNCDHSGIVCFGTETGDPIPFPLFARREMKDLVAYRVKAGAFSIMSLLREADARMIPAGDLVGELEINCNRPSDMVGYFGKSLSDPFGRRLHYLRFSLTEACNLSCTYCLPEGFPEWYRHKARLRRDDVVTLLEGFRLLGFRKVRFTGGEPTVHPGCKDTIVRARKLGYEEIAMTTNGLLLRDLESWQQAGLTHLNVSLDSLVEEEFEAITKHRGATKIKQLVEEAVALGIKTKVNAVVLRSINGSANSLGRLIDWAMVVGCDLRFIELMETKLNGSFSSNERMLGTEVEPLLFERGMTLVGPEGTLKLGGPAEYYKNPQFPGRIGLINPMSCNFCSKCNRLRVTARGELKMCLFGESNVELDLSSPAAVALKVRQVIDKKPERHYLEDGKVGNVSTFRTIGG